MVRAPMLHDARSAGPTAPLALLLALVVAGCAGEPLAPTQASGRALAATSSSASRGGEEEAEMVVITPAVLPAVGHTGQLLATACEPGTGEQKKHVATACPVGWVHDSDAHITWFTTDAGAATVTSTGLVTRLREGPVGITAFSSDNGGACTTVGNVSEPVYIQFTRKKSTRSIRCTLIAGDDEAPGTPS